ncbi:MAG: ABC transporter ATP-binding protein [Syntrophorhabdales bacterium]|jgi:peptide/nickel transport system ATP-binding protein
MSLLLRVEDLKTQFTTERGLVRAVDGVSYDIEEGEIIGLVGESGCGKSVSQLSIMRLIPSPPGEIVGGRVMFEGQDLLGFEANSAEMRAIRGGKIAMIFQEPMTSLNPALTIARQLTEVMQLHLNMDGAAARERSVELLGLVGIPDGERRIDDYPHQFSGGMRQRVMVAMAVSCNPRLIIADEPTTALDATIQAQLLELMKDIVVRFNTSMVMVTHNLGIVARYAHRINVMYAGRIVESGTVKEIWDNPLHPYTIGLLQCVPKLGSRLTPIRGFPPHLINMGLTCPFLPRCGFRKDSCETDAWSPLRHVEGRHYVACPVDTRSAQSRQPKGTGDGAASGERVEFASEKASPSAGHDELVLDVRDLRMYFPVTRGLLRRKVADVKAVDNVSFKIRRGETLGLVGESGCGKTTVGRCAQRLYRPTAGQIFFEGEDVARLPESKLKTLRRRMTVVFQDPYGSLNPRMSAGSIVGEPLGVHGLVKNNRERAEKIEELFLMAGLDPSMTDRFPHEFSGGQRQRIAIARALGGDPSLIICDEPISALDVSIQAQIINLLQELQQKKKGLTYMFISHDLLAVQYISTRVAVMYLGRIVEIASSTELYENTLHPYSRALLSAIPVPDPHIEEGRERIILQGDVPSPLNPPPGCHFHTRCPIAEPECCRVVPALRDIGGGHEVACAKV